MAHLPVPHEKGELSPLPARQLIGYSLVPAALAAAVLIIPMRPAQAVPAYAQQTGLACSSCHVGGFGPQLTPLGREFKLNGYTMRSGKSVPISAMGIVSLTHTKADQVPPPDDLDRNDNLAFDQGSVFVAGGLGKHFGIFSQTTYDGVGKAWSWDNTDIRAVTTGKLFGADTTFGLTLNNGPTIQDAWNTTPAWGFPYTDTAVSGTPGAAPLIDGGLSQEVIGLSAYAWIGHKAYLEAGAYSTPSAGTLRWLGADPSGGPGDIRGLAPYGRVAWQGDAAGGTLELGAFGLSAAVHPDRDRTSPYTDRFTDLGLDASWQKMLGSGDVLSAQARYIHEKARYRASCELGLLGEGGSPDCANVSLDQLRVDMSYHWHNKLGATLGLFSTTGNGNANLYDGSGSPDSDGFTLQLDYSPWGDGNGPLGKRVNLQFGLQYTGYGKFDGASAWASDKNAVRVYSWLAF